MNIDPNEPTRLSTIDEAPETFARTFRDSFPSLKTGRLLIYAPGVTVEDVKLAATLLVVTDDGWILGSENANGSVSLDKCSFSETLFIQVTSIVLWGSLKIDYASVGTSYSAVMWFNTVGEEFYKEAVDFMLRRIDQAEPSPIEGSGVLNRELESWPLHFRSQALRYWPAKQRLLGTARWPAIVGGFRRELAPAAALLASERELVLISDEKAPSWAENGSAAKLGGIVTYFPLVRLADYHVSHQERFSVLALEVHASHGGEKLEILFPSDRESQVLKAVEQTRIAGAVV
jgi:hypothetical protein